jgi:hypothetical protein
MAGTHDASISSCHHQNLAYSSRGFISALKS